MTDEERIAWIDQATYADLMEKWRFEPIGSPWFAGKVGFHFNDVFKRVRADTPHHERVAVSRQLGFS